jgi:hypothetical protein
MSDLHKIPQQSLEALEDLRVWRAKQSMDVTALRAALAQQAEPVEPVAWIQPDPLQKARIAPFLCRVEPTQRCADFVPFYLAPPQRQPLTEEEIDAEWRELDGEVSTMFMRVLRKFARAIERAHGIVTCGDTKEGI